MPRIVVFPVPGGPHKMNEKRGFFSTAARRGLPLPTKCSCPTTSSSVCGRIRAARGSIALLYAFRFCADGGSRTRADCLEGSRHTVRPRPRYRENTTDGTFWHRSDRLYLCRSSTGSLSSPQSPSFFLLRPSALPFQNPCRKSFAPPRKHSRYIRVLT